MPQAFDQRFSQQGIGTLRIHIMMAHLLGLDRERLRVDSEDSKSSALSNVMILSFCDDLVIVVRWSVRLL